MMMMMMLATRKIYFVHYSWEKLIEHFWVIGCVVPKETTRDMWTLFENLSLGTSWKLFHGQKKCFWETFPLYLVKVAPLKAPAEPGLQWQQGLLLAGGWPQIQMQFECPKKSKGIKNQTNFILGFWGSRWASSLTLVYSSSEQSVDFCCLWWARKRTRTGTHKVRRTHHSVNCAKLIDWMGPLDQPRVVSDTSAEGHPMFSWCSWGMLLKKPP